MVNIYSAREGLTEIAPGLFSSPDGQSTVLVIGTVSSTLPPVSPQPQHRPITASVVTARGRGDKVELTFGSGSAASACGMHGFHRCRGHYRR